MIKSGLIFGGVLLVAQVLTGAVLNPLCGLCVGLVIGSATGFVAGLFDKPADSGAGAKSGAGAGAIAGVGALIGFIGADIIRGFLIKPEDVAAMAQNMGLPVTNDPTI